MAKPVSPVSLALPVSPALTHPEDQFPPLMRAMFDALNSFLQEKDNPLPSFLRWGDEKGETCVPIASSPPTFMCTFHLNSYRCNCSCAWDNGTVVFGCAIYDMSDDFLERSKIYLDSLNRSGLRPAALIEPSITSLQCCWKITSPEEMKNALSTFEDIFEPARWPEELAGAYLRGAEAFPLHCSQLDAQKKVQEIILTLDVFTHLIKNNEDIPHLPQWALNCSVSKDPQVQWRIGGLFKTLIGQGKGFQEACKTAENLIRALRSEDEYECEGVKILMALAEQGFFSPDSLDVFARSPHTSPQFAVDVRKFIDRVLADGHEQEVLKKALAFYQNSYPPTRLFALVLWDALFCKGYGFEEAKGLVSPLTPSSVDNQKLKLLLLFIPHKHFHAEALQIARVLVGSILSFEAEQGLEIYRKLILLEQGCDEALEDANSRFHSANTSDKKVTFQLLKALVLKGKGYAQATEIAVKAFNSTTDYLKNEGLLLLQTLVQKGQAIQEAIDCARAAVGRTTYVIMKEGYQLLTLLVDRGEAIEIAKAWAADEKDAGIKEKELWQLILWEALVKQGHSFKEAEKAALAGASVSKKSEIQYSALSLFTTLVERGKSISKARKALHTLFGSDDKTLKYAFAVLYNALNAASLMRTFF